MLLTWEYIKNFKGNIDGTLTCFQDVRKIVYHFQEKF